MPVCAGVKSTQLNRVAKKKYQIHSGPSEGEYRNLSLASLAAVLFVLILLVRLWPEHQHLPQFDFDIPEQGITYLEEIEITRQESSPPAPPKPVVPFPVPNDEIIEEEIEFEAEIDLSKLPELEPGQGTGQSGDEARVVGNPQVPPSVVRIVEATAPKGVPDEYEGNLEMIVNFLVDEEGNVEEVSIMEIRLYEENGVDYRQLPFVQHGLMDAVIKAAMQWKFRPARQNGEPVKAFTRQRFNY